MSGGNGISGMALAGLAIGGIIVWSGIENASLVSAFRSLLGGKKPAASTGSESINTSSSGSSPGGGSSSNAQYVGGEPPDATTVDAYKAYAQVLLASHGWAGQFSAFNSIVEAESGWNPKATNPTSGAFGIAQALGHGQGSATEAADGQNNYGNYGTSNAVCKLANGGSGNAQIEWMCNYIAAAYGSPDAAWSYHQANGNY